MNQRQPNPSPNPTPQSSPNPTATMQPQSFTSLSEEQQAQFLENIDWATLIPAGIALFQHIQSGQLIADWQRTLDIIKDILEALSVAEQQSMLKIDWATLLPLILKYLLPILIGIGGKDPIEV